MSDKLNALYRQTLSEIAATELLLTELQIKRATLEEAGAAANGAVPALLAPGGHAHVRATVGAPRGALQKAIKEAVAAKPAMTNGEIRDAIAKAGYRYTIDPIAVGKALGKLVTSKLLLQTQKGARWEYRISK